MSHKVPLARYCGCSRLDLVIRGPVAITKGFPQPGKTNTCWGWSQIAKFMGPIWGPPGSCRPQMGPMMAPWTLLSGMPTNRFLSSAMWRASQFVTLHVYYPVQEPPSRAFLSWSKVMPSPTQVEPLGIIQRTSMRKLWIGHPKVRAWIP